MYYDPNMYRYQHPYNPDVPMYSDEVRPFIGHHLMRRFMLTNLIMSTHTNNKRNVLHDYGKKPFVVNINEATRQNKYYRKAIWTGNHLQVTLMSINVGEDIGLEVHPTVDQFLRVEDGKGIVRMGPRKDHLDFEERVTDDYAIMVPAGTWHNVINTGNKPLKLYSIYAPPNHPFGTVHKTKAAAMAAEEHHG